MLFAAALLLLCGQSANAAIRITALSGSGFGEGEGCQKLFDGTQDTKWGTWDGWYHTYENNADLPNAIFKSSLPIAVADYELVIANDTKDSPGRNWKSWRIFGGNFASDDDATLNAEGWVLIDEKVDQKLTTDQFAVVPLSVSNPDGKFYSYFMIIVDAICSENAFDDYTQMDEFRFTKYTVDVNAYEELINKCKEFDLTDVDEPLVAEYNAKLKVLTSSEDPEVIEKLIGELGSLQDFITKYKDKPFAPINAVGEGVWGDGSWENLIDGDMNTKCGGDVPQSGAWLVFRANGGASPFVYSLTTGKDTKKYPGRNWKTWKIYGGNFETTDAATRDAEGWVLLDSRENIGQDMFPPENLSAAAFSFSEFSNGLDKKYYYFRVELEAAYDGTQYQMTELEFLTKEQVEDTRSKFLSEFDDFDVDALNVESTVEDAKTEYKAKMEELKTTNDVMAMSKAYNAMKELRKQLQASADFVAGDVFHVLSGNTAWGDGENWTKLLDGDIETKWGGGMPEGGSYVIFKGYEKKLFSAYELVTGNDTGRSPGRNWKTWKIYGASIKGDMDDMATRDFTGWKLIDQKTDIGQDQLPAANFAPAFFTLSEEITSKYKYFKVEVEAAYEGGSIQMSELKMFTDDDWKAVCKEYVDSLNNLKTAVLGDLILAEPVAKDVADAIAAVSEAKPEELLAKFAAAHEVIKNAPKNNWLAAYQLTEKDGVLQLGKAEDLVNFARVINDGTTKTETTFIDAVLTADIDLSDAITEENPWIPIGNWGAVSYGNACYKGHFDGQGHTIKGFNATSTQNYFGIFGVISTGALIENFDIYGTINTTIQNAGSVAGYARDEGPTIRNIHSFVNINNTCAGGRQGGILGNSNVGTVVVDNCWYSGTLDGNDAANNGNYGGIVGYVQNKATAIVTISNCLFDGKLINTAETPGNCTFGGVVGYNNGGKATIKNCLSIGTLQSAITGQFFGKINGNNSIFANNYYKGEFVNGNGSAGTVSGDAPVKVTADQLKSGEVAVKLAPAFRQNIGSDETPVLDSTHGYVAEITAAGWATQYIKAEDVEIPEGVKAFAGEVTEAGYLKLNAIEGKIAAGEAVVLKGTAGFYSFVPTTDAVKAEKNDLKGAAEDMEAAGKYVLAKPEGKEAGFYKAETGTLKAGKAYLESTAEVKAFFFDIDEETGIESIDNSQLSTVNSQLIYNLSGQRVNKAQKGIYIVNGKKVLK